MQCLKCGRDTQDKEVFCPDCLRVMASSPVKPDAVVNLPHRAPVKKQAPAKKPPKPEAVIARLNKSVRRLRIAVAILCVLFALTTGALSFFLYQSYSQPDIGSNYNTISSDPT